MVRNECEGRKGNGLIGRMRDDILISLINNDNLYKVKKEIPCYD